MNESNAKVILVVDDEPAIRRLIAAELSDAGYETIQAGNGLEALEVLRTVRPAAVVLDLAMPDVDGWAFLGVYQFVSHAALPVIVASGDVSAAVRQRLRVLGIQHCLVKPFEMEDLRATLEQVLSEHQPPPEQPTDGRWSDARVKELLDGVRSDLAPAPRG